MLFAPAHVALDCARKLNSLELKYRRMKSLFKEQGGYRYYQIICSNIKDSEASSTLRILKHLEEEYIYRYKAKKNFHHSL